MAQDTKTALLDSAEAAVRARGFDGFSYADLATDVGIRKASVHHHFATKAALSVALMRRYYEGLAAARGDIEDENEAGSARLQAFVSLYRDAMQDGKSLCLCVALSTSRESLPSEVILEISRFRTVTIDWIKGVFELGQRDGTILNVDDPEAEATAVLPLLEGAQLAARAEEDMALFDAAVGLLRRRLV